MPESILPILGGMQGLMQHWPLTVDKILSHAARWHGTREVVTRSGSTGFVRTNYSSINDRARRLSAALQTLGIEPGMRVATLMWNTAAHIEAWYAIMGMGAVCHTLNPRLPVEQLTWIAHHADDRAIIITPDLLPLLSGLLEHFTGLGHIIVTSDPDISRADPHGVRGRKLLDFDQLIASHSPLPSWGSFPEDQACGLCYTSGTTGAPKGVLYSHRSNFLHTLTVLQADVFGTTAREVVLPVVPMFHANAWGLPFAAPAVGAKLVMPGNRLDGQSLYELIQAEAVTFAAAVPTVWQGLLSYAGDARLSLRPLRRVVIGGAACPEWMVQAFTEDHGVKVIHAWGMTETSPVGTTFSPHAHYDDLDPAERARLRSTQGRPSLGLDLKIEDDQGRALEHDGRQFGRLRVRGPYVASGYFHAETDSVDAEGWFDTGDVATVDPCGFMRITDRAKDLIKSGGEWISSQVIESVAASHPKTALAAVIGVPHPKWGERPLLFVKLFPGQHADSREYLEFLGGKIPRWWLPDKVVIVPELPLGATGKIDKKTLRHRFR